MCVCVCVYKDPDTWLDEKDPRRHITKKYLKVQNICLKHVLQRKKQALYKVLPHTEKLLT